MPDKTAAAPEWDVFRRLLSADELDALDPRAPQCVYTPFVTVWLLVFQRLNGNATLAEAVAELASRFPAESLSPDRAARLPELSANTGAYAAARLALDAAVLDRAAANSFESLVSTYPPSWRDRRVFILDGTTVTLAPTPALKAAYPPASNQYGPSAWPVLHLLVAHELASGLAAPMAFGPKYGPEAKSELDLARDVIPRLPKGGILLADRNFGIFAVAHAAASAGHGVVTRLTDARFKALRKGAVPDGPGRWRATWRPSGHDRRAHPELPADAAVAGWLHEVAVGGGRALVLFVTVAGSGADLAGLYRGRGAVETDLRDLKLTLALDQMTCRSAAMVEKELKAAVLAYNLTNQVRRLAATRAGVEPRRLSFAGTWSLVKAFLGLGFDLGQAEFDRLLRAAGQRKLPNRKPGRAYPREVLGRARKFPKRKRAEPDPKP